MAATVSAAGTVRNIASGDIAIRDCRELDFIGKK
jgi:hypothetical protein